MQFQTSFENRLKKYTRSERNGREEVQETFQFLASSGRCCSHQERSVLAALMRHFPCGTPYVSDRCHLTKAPPAWHLLTPLGWSSFYGCLFHGTSPFLRRRRDERNNIAADSGRVSSQLFKIKSFGVESALRGDWVNFKGNGLGLKDVRNISKIILKVDQNLIATKICSRL